MAAVCGALLTANEPTCAAEATADHVERPLWGLAWTGILMGGTLHLGTASAGIAIASSGMNEDDTRYYWLTVPIAGPVVIGAELLARDSELEAASHAAGAVMLVNAGVQVTAVVLMVAGLASRTPILEGQLTVQWAPTGLGLAF